MDCLDFLFSDETSVPSPCFVLDEARLAANAAILGEVQRRTGARILLALKGYAAWGTFPLLSRTARGRSGAFAPVPWTKRVWGGRNSAVKCTLSPPPGLRRKSPNCWIWRTILSLIPRPSGGNSGRHRSAQPRAPR